MRPIFLHYPEQAFYATKDAYLLGGDLFVAPVLEEGAVERTLVLPDDEWIHLFTKEAYRGGEHTVAAPLLHPAVFYRAGSAYRELFASVQ